MTTNRYLTPAAYARLCGVSRTAIMKRVESGRINLTIRDNPDGTRSKYVDCETYPPEKMGKNRKPI
jgi:hypothetical protein